MNLYDLLHDDHEKVKGLFQQLEVIRESESAKRERVFSSLFQEVDVHAMAEERFFYSRLKNDEDTRELALEAMDEHKVITRLMEELDAMDKGSPEWRARLKVLRQDVEQHIRDEETELFPQARKVLDEDEADAIAEEIEAFKEEHSELEAY